MTPQIGIASTTTPSSLRTAARSALCILHPTHLVSVPHDIQLSSLINFSSFNGFDYSQGK